MTFQVGDIVQILVGVYRDHQAIIRGIDKRPKNYSYLVSIKGTTNKDRKCYQGNQLKLFGNPTIVTAFQVGDNVEILTGQAKGDVGTIDSINITGADIIYRVQIAGFLFTLDYKANELKTSSVHPTRVTISAMPYQQDPVDKGNELYSCYYSGTQVTFYENGIQLNSHFETTMYWTYASYQYIDDKIGTFRGFAATNMPDILDMFHKLTTGSRTGINNTPKYTFETFIRDFDKVECEVVTGIPAADYDKIQLPGRIRDSL